MLGGGSGGGGVSSAIAISHTSAPYISTYPWGESGFGTKFANPSTLPAGTALGVTFN